MDTMLKKKTISGIQWSYLATLVNAVGQIGYTAVMARLLDPKAFGVVALAGVILRFGVYFSQMGVGQAIIQKEKLSDREIRSAFTVSVFLGLIFLVFVWVLSPFIRFFYDQSILSPVVRLLAVSLLINNLAATAVSLLRREMRFKHLAVVQIVSQILSFAAVGIPAAFMGFGVWSLVFATLMHSAITCLGSYLLVRHDLRFFFEWKTYRPLFSFGSRISIISFFEFLGSSVDTLLIGRYLGPVQLGFYNRAYMLANLLQQQLSTSLSSVLFPSFSKMQNDIKELQQIFFKSTSIISLFIFPLCFSISIAAEQVIYVILGTQWLDAVAVLRIISLAVPFQILSHFSGVVCDSVAKLYKKLFLQITVVCIMISGIILFYSYGLVTIAYFLLFIALARNIGFWVILKPILNYKINDLYNYFKWPILLTFYICVGLYIITIIAVFFKINLCYIIIIQIFYVLLFFILFIKKNRVFASLKLNLKTFCFENQYIENILCKVFGLI